MNKIKFLGGFTLSFAILLFIITSCNTSGTNIIDDKPEVGFTKVHTTQVGSASANIVAPVGEVNIEVGASSASLLNPIEKVTVAVVDGTQRGEDDSAPFVIPITFSSEGEYQLVAKAIDKNGRTSNEQTIMVTIVSSDGAQAGQAVPTASWRTPVQNETVSGNVLLEIEATDFNDPLISGDDGQITKVEFFAGSHLIGAGDLTSSNLYRFLWDSTGPTPSNSAFFDGEWDLTAVVTDNEGYSASVTQTVKLDNAVAPPEIQAEVKVKNIRPTPKVLVGCVANTNSDPNFDPALLGCFTGSITVDVTVTDDTGAAEVTLRYFNETQKEGNVIGRSSTWPYQFEFDTTNHNNGDMITFSAEITSGEYSVQGPVSDPIVVYNEILPPILTILSPTSETSEVNGLMDVKVGVDNLSANDYTMDLNGDNVVDHGSNALEGILVEFLLQDGNDDNKLAVADERISDANLIQTMFAELDGKYETPRGFDTSNYANREYILKASARFKRISTGEVFTLEDEVRVRTLNSGPVPPSVLILSPVNGSNGAARIIRDPSDAYISVQGTDDQGIVHMELEIFTGDVQYDETPSRFVQALIPASTYVKAALPVNYNAHPYIPNSPPGTDYTIRVTTQDTDGNRTHQDTKIRLDRATQPLYYLEHVGPDIDNDGNPDVDDVVTFAIKKYGGSLDGTERFDHLVREHSEITFRPYTDASSVNSAFGVGLTKKDVTYYIQGQVITDQGEVYTTNTIAIVNPSAQ